MNKKLFLLPCAVLLAGCMPIGGLPGQNNNNNEVTMPNDSEIALSVLEEAGEITTFTEGGHTYKIHEGAPENDHEYFWGFYHQEVSKLYVFHGGMHKNKDKPSAEYPFYMGCNEATFEGAAKIKTHYINNDEFTMQVVTTGSGRDYGSGAVADGSYWKDKYIHFYNSHNTTYGDKYQTSIEPVSASKLDDGWGNFRFRYQITDSAQEETIPIYGPACWMQNEEDSNYAELEFKSFGTQEDPNHKDVYQSIECRSADQAALDTAFHAHFWEMVS